MNGHAASRALNRRGIPFLHVALCVVAACHPRALAAEEESPKLLVAPLSQAEAQHARAAWAQHMGEAEQLANRLGMKFALIPPGRFSMGSPSTEERRRATEQQHSVTISLPFHMSVTEVTQQQWQLMMKTAPWQGKRFVRAGDDYPAMYVNWDDATEFCRRLSEAEDRTYRLPTEAEWEYACRSGTTTAYSFGNDAAQMNEHGWIGPNTFDAGAKFAHLTGRKPANPLGLHDMHGNVWEWCADWYTPTPGEDDKVDPRGPPEGLQRVIRGGSWHGAAHLCRSAHRFYRRPAMRTNDVGFRVVALPKK